MNHDDPTPSCHVPAHDLAIHPRDDNLIIGTHGRGLSILDNLAPDKLAADMAFLDSRPSTLLGFGGLGFQRRHRVLGP